ncbi:MAG: hypothetical protein JXD23_04190 [Spirochaetales bacterium]|nr:hypothetical protein [Spirochaetales bacterium]
MKFGKCLIAVVTLAAIAALSASCGGAGKYADAVKLLQEAIAANETFVKTMETAADGDAAAAAISAYAASFKTLGRQIEDLEGKYPELGENTPPELRDIEAKYEKTSKEAVQTLMSKAAVFAANDKVTAALQAFEDIE